MQNYVIIFNMYKSWNITSFEDNIPSTHTDVDKSVDRNETYRKTSNREYPAKRALSAMRKHGG